MNESPKLLGFSFTSSNTVGLTADNVKIRGKPGNNQFYISMLVLSIKFFFIDRYFWTLKYRLEHRELKLDGAIGHFAEPL